MSEGSQVHKVTQKLWSFTSYQSEQMTGPSNEKEEKHANDQKYQKQKVEILQIISGNTKNKQWKYYKQKIEILQTNSGNTTNKRQKYYKQIVELLPTNSGNSTN